MTVAQLPDGSPDPFFTSSKRARFSVLSWVHGLLRHPSQLLFAVGCGYVTKNLLANGMIPKYGLAMLGNFPLQKLALPFASSSSWLKGMWV